jgi:hypothetical protein
MASKADEKLLKVQKELLEATSNVETARSKLCGLEELLQRRFGQTFSRDEAETGHPNEGWFVERAWATYRKPLSDPLP